MMVIKILSKSVNSPVNLKVTTLQNSTSKEILKHLPIKSKVKKWGDEIYFDTGLDIPVQNLTQEVSIGDVAYWPGGRCICIFFGRTPASKDEKPVPASEVVIIGKAELVPEFLHRVENGAEVFVE